MFDGRLPGFNSLKKILYLMKSIISLPIKLLSNLIGFAKSEIRNFYKGGILFTSVSGNNRTSISFVIKVVSISNLFLIELIFNCPIVIQFGFSSLRICKVSVALLLFLFSQILSFFS